MVAPAGVPRMGETEREEFLEELVDRKVAGRSFQCSSIRPDWCDLTVGSGGREVADAGGGGGATYMVERGVCAWA